MATPSICIDKLFREARTHSAWLDKPVSDETLRELYNALKWGADQRECLAGPFSLYSHCEGQGKASQKYLKF